MPATATAPVQAARNGRSSVRSRRLVGVAAWLGYLTAIVVVGAMVAASFGDYAAVLLADAPPGGWLSKLPLAGAWTEHRDMPKPAAQSFMAQYKKGRRS